MDGILLVDKPKGWTSFDVVAKVRGVLKKQLQTTNPQLKTIKVGHTGTLDPLATGLLVLLVGKATKQATELSKVDKTYVAVLKLGQTSTTGDEEGEKTKTSAKKPSLEEIQKILDSFLGEIEQIPPIYSAIKIDGQKAYKLARAGKEVKMEPRKVKIYQITDVDYDYPNLKFTCKVSSGTYIRTLAEDIGKKLGTGAYLTNLNRTQVGEFKLEAAINVQKIKAEAIYDKLNKA
ncbi:MAG: tRNA pseudouridine(55) synthase TruB [Minisyncoccia bacterium]